MKKKEYYIFDKVIKFNGSDEGSLRLHLKSWNTLHDYLSKIDDELSEDELIKLIVIEKESENRNHMVTRIHSRMISLRRNKQKAELGIS